MCSKFTPDCGYDNSAIIFIVDVHCPNTKCLGKLCLHKSTFQPLGDYQCPQSPSVCQVRNTPFEDQTNSFFLSFGRGVYIFKRIQNQFKMSLEMCIVPASFVSTKRNANPLVVMQQLRDPFMVVTIVEPGCLFTKFVTRAGTDDTNRQNTLFL